MPNKTITVKNVDIDLLREQHSLLISLREFTCKPEFSLYKTLSGLIHFLDACIDAADKE
jgi:hypothetical protein